MDARAVKLVEAEMETRRALNMATKDYNLALVRCLHSFGTRGLIRSLVSRQRRRKLRGNRTRCAKRTII